MKRLGFAMPLCAAIICAGMASGCGSGGGNGGFNMITDTHDGIISSSDFLYSDGSYADVFVLVANSSGQALVTNQSNSFPAWIRVDDVNSDGSLGTDIGSNSGNYPGDTAGVRFNVNAGYQYVVEVGTAGPNEFGDYTFQYSDNLTYYGQVGPGNGFGLIPETLDTTLSSSDYAFSDGSYYDAFALTASHGGTTTLEVVSNDYAPYVQASVLNSDGSLGSNEGYADANGNTALMTFQATAGQTYYVQVSSMLPGATGNYQFYYSDNLGTINELAIVKPLRRVQKQCLLGPSVTPQIKLPRIMTKNR